MKRIFYVKQHSVFSTDGQSGRLWREEKHAHWLSEAGHKVLWLTSDFDHYGKVRRQITPDIEGVEVRQFSVPQYKKNVSITRLLGNWLFAIQLLFLLLLRRKRIDKIVCAYPTPESCLICVLVSKLTCLPLIIDMRDNWPEALASGSRLSLVAKLFIAYSNSLNFIIFSLHGYYIGMSDGVLKKIKLLRKNKLTELCLALPNTISIDSQVKEIPVSLENGKVYISFFGTLNSQFTFDMLSDSLNEIKQKYPHVIFLIVGDGERYDEYKKAFCGFPNVQFLGRKKYGEVLYIAHKSSAFFSFYNNPDIYASHFTNKLIEYLQFGKPFIHNLKRDFFLNNVRYEVGYSVLDISLVQFVKQLVTAIGSGKTDNSNNCDLSEFSELHVKAKFLEVFE